MTPPAWLVPGAIAGVLWLGCLLFLLGLRRSHSRRGALQPIALGAMSLLFLGSTVRAGVIQDYYLYLRMWREIRLGHDPWFRIQGVFGTYPLNAYGPLFNLLAIPAWVHPLLPKLLIAATYLLLAFWLIEQHDGSWPTGLWLLAWFWNPFVWVEVACFGHFDVLVGLACVAAAEYRRRRRDLTAGACLGLGVLVKYMPIVLLPFLALDGRGVRWRLSLAAMSVIVVGLGISIFCWGPSVFRPVTFAASRGASHLSIYRFLISGYTDCPALGSFQPRYLEPWAPLILFLALLRTWSWHRERDIEVEPAMVIALFATVLLYQVGFSQYQMIPFVMVSWWLLRPSRAIQHRRPLTLALATYFAWLSVFDLLDWNYGIDTLHIEAWVGLPTFLLGLTLLVCLVGVARTSSGSADR